MNRFWDKIILPIIQSIEANYIVEVGSDTGLNTMNILDYCKDNNAHMTAIDPFPKFDIQEFKKKYGNRFEIYEELSLEVLPRLKNYDAILLDGDHNWYTVYNELKTIADSFEGKKFPVVFLHDISWPYGRRDLYYNPKDIPADYRQPYKKLGIHPAEPNLQAHNGLNSSFNNSIYENNPKNGVLTAIEDFIDESELDFSFEVLNAYFGLGILFPKNEELNETIQSIIKDADFLNILEKERISLALNQGKSVRENNSLKKRLNLKEKQLKRKNSQINLLETQLKEKELEVFEQRSMNQELLCKLDYITGKNRPLKQKIISKFPFAYIIANIPKTGFKQAFTNIKGYNAIKSQGLLDLGYYLKNNDDVKLSGMDPVLNYIYYGFREGRKPNPLFDGDYYLKSNSDVEKLNMNPLIHYSLYGIKEGRKTTPLIHSSLNQNSGKLKKNLKKIKIDIVICVHNALKDVKICIDSIIKKTNLKYRVILINDGSDDETSSYLKKISNNQENFVLLEHDVSQGYTKSANSGMKLSKADYVILLNSDTVVSTNWLENIIICGESDPEIGLIGPLSNAATYQSIPKVKTSKGDWYINKLPKNYSIDDMANIIQKISNKSYPSVPALNGFCMTIKRSVIDSIGYLDEKNFPIGYGEETDYCLRAINSNFKCVIADNTYIFHSKSKSFGHEKRASFSKNSWNVLKNKHGSKRLSNTLKELEEDEILSKIRYDLSKYLDKKGISKDYENESIGKISDLAQIFLIDESNDIEKISKTINSIENIDEKLSTTILCSESCKYVPINKNFEINHYKKSSEIIDKLNFLIGETKAEFLLFVYSGNELKYSAIQSLKENISELNRGKIAAIVLDDCVIDNDKKFPRFKTGFSPEYYLENDYIGNSIWIMRSNLIDIGGFNPEYVKSYIKDAIIRLWETENEIIKNDVLGLNVPVKNLYQSFEEQKSLLKNILDRRQNPYVLEKKGEFLRPKYDTDDSFASIIIPFKDQAQVTEKCVDSILKLTDYDNYEIILVNNNSIEENTKQYLDSLKDKKIRILNYLEPFNYSKMNNFAVRHALGNVIVFLNNDTEVINPLWLTELIGDAIQNSIGAVGGLLYYPDKTIQHAGVVIGLNGLAGHLFAGKKESELPSEWKKCRRNVSAVTGACMGIKKDTFEKIGGFNEDFDITGSDVEICLRLIENGYRNIINPEVKLFHYEKKTRSKISVRDKDIRMSIIAYKPYLENGDPYFNKNLSLNSSDLTINKEEYPIYQEFLDKYYAEKSKHMKKLSRVLNSNNKTSNLNSEVLKYDVSPLELEKNQELMARFKRNPNLELNTVLWFIPFFDHVYRGGIYTIFRTAQYLSIKAGTKNIIVLYGKGKLNLDNVENELLDAFPEMNFEVLNLNEYENETDLPNSDAAFCTLWTSAYHLVKYNNCRAKFYFNQDFEPLFYSASSIYGLIEQTYRFGFIGIANTMGVKKAHSKYNKWVTHFTPAIDKKTFYPDENRKNDKFRVVFYGRPNNPRNGFELGIESLKLVKSYFGDKVDIISVGGEFDESEYGLEGILRNEGLLPTINDVAKLYRNCDVGLVFMFTPHPSYQPLEYMASGCATVTNINESNLWLLRDKENAILTEPNITSVANNIINLLENEGLRNTIIKNGIDTVSSTTWEVELDNLYQFIINPVKME